MMKINEAIIPVKRKSGTGQIYVCATRERRGEFTHYRNKITETAEEFYDELYTLTRIMLLN